MPGFVTPPSPLDSSENFSKTSFRCTRTEGVKKSMVLSRDAEDGASPPARTCGGLASSALKVVQKGGVVSVAIQRKMYPLAKLRLRGVSNLCVWSGRKVKGE